MVNKLLNYVEEQLGKGYKPESIKSTLIRQGYSPGLVEGVIDSVSMKKPTTSSALRPVGTSYEKSVFPKLALVLVFLIVVILGAVFIPKLIGGKQALLDIKAEADKNSYEQGEKLGFNIEITNMGSADKFDVTLIYRLLDNNENTILSKEETLAISTSMSHHRTLDMPTNLRPGDYTLKVFANYEGKVATSAFSFNMGERVIVTETCSDNVKNQDEAGPDCGGVCGGYWYDGTCHATPREIPVPGPEESCNDGIKNQDESGVDCGGVCGGYWYDGTCHAIPKPVTPAKPSLAAVMINARKIAESNPEDAKNMCMELEKTEEKDKCIKTIAQVSMKKEYCELIIGVDDRDECYYIFFMQGDYSVCEKLTDPQSMDTCEQLRELSIITEQLNQTTN